jgi:hypothetical protein
MRLRRQRIGLNATDLSDVLGWSFSKTSRVELGMYRVSEVEVVHYLAACGVPHDELNALVELKHDEERDLGYWMRPPASSLRSLVYHESTAIRRFSYEPNVVPGLLQTEQYAAALIRAADVSDEVFSASLGARMERQALLGRRDPVENIFFIHERALRMPVGDASIMNEQLLHLVFSTARPRIGIRVVPMSAGAQSACMNTFLLFDYRKEHRPLVYLESWTGALFLDGDRDIASYREMVPKLDAVALSDGQSRDFLTAMASEYEQAAWRNDFSPKADPEPLLSQVQND